LYAENSTSCVLSLEEDMTFNVLINGANNYLKVSSAGIETKAITASGLITANSGLTVSGTLTAGAITASGLITANSGLTVSGTLTAGAITASGLITASNGLTVSSGKTLTLNASALFKDSAGNSTNIYLAGGNMLYDNDSDGGTHQFYVNLIGGTQTLVCTIESSGLRMHTGLNVQANSFNSVSDYRIKSNVQPITSANYQVDALNPVCYYNTASNKTDLGFIAHEVQEHFPMLVSGVKDGPSNQSINYSGLIPILVSEIKELKMQMQQMKQELQEIKRSHV
jgi:hypothetical protein